MTEHITDADFKEYLAKNSPVLVDFWAQWCQPCLAVAPVLDKLSSEQSKLKIVKMNVDENPKVASQYGIMSIPTLMIFKDGKPVSNIVGFRPKDELKKSLDAALG